MSTVSVATRVVSLVIGLGEVGRPLLEVLSNHHAVEGVDLSPKTVDASVDLMHVCYPAEIKDFIGITRHYYDRYRPEIIVIHSTVPVGTTASVEKVVPVPVVHSPVRGKHARMAAELLTYTKFIGARDPGVAQRVEGYFRNAGMTVRSLSSPEATELAKLTETTYFGVLIAFAQDIDRMARETGVEYDELVSFYDEIAYLPRVRFFPGAIGGHCVMPNIKLLKARYSSRLLDAVEWSNELRKRED
jgi:UDP-N-acetyl-D-mannosaminuronate dehydrogenase